ncbi:MAG: 3-deoxy-7-phosphoheptulonate synthase [Patescibacteria group bacterium]
MGIHVVQDLPTPARLDKLYPIGPKHHVDAHRSATQAILAGHDKRLLMITGPCSAWPPEAVDAYAEKLERLQEDVQQQVFCLMRVYIQKPRTALGWPGPHNQPDPLGEPDIQEGIHQCRELMCRVGQKVPIADEMLFTGNVPHFDKLVTYTAVGARSTQDSDHRFHASGLDGPVGIKNPTSGNIEVGVDGVQVAQHANDFVRNNQWVRSHGNPSAHLILRGGEQGPNYSPQHISLASQLLMDPRREIKNPAIIIDASHDNCRNGKGKDPELQLVVLDSVMSGIRRQREEYQLVRGFMLESFLKGGCQKIGPDMKRDGTSITDPCLSWDRTEQAIREIANQHAAVR